MHDGLRLGRSVSAAHLPFQNQLMACEPYDRELCLLRLLRRKPSANRRLVHGRARALLWRCLQPSRHPLRRWLPRSGRLSASKCCVPREGAQGSRRSWKAVCAPAWVLVTWLLERGHIQGTEEHRTKQQLQWRFSKTGRLLNMCFRMCRFRDGRNSRPGLESRLWCAVCGGGERQLVDLGPPAIELLLHAGFLATNAHHGVLLV